MIEVMYSSLATYAITLVLSNYGGPFDIFARWRAGRSELWSCFVCLSFWVGLVIAILSRLTLQEYFAVVGLSILMWKVSER